MTSDASDGRCHRERPSAYRLDYRFDSRLRYVTKRIEVEAHGQGWRRRLSLERDKAGEWDAEWETHGKALSGRPPAT